MANFSVPVQINGMETTKNAIQNFMKNAEFTEDTTEEYKKGFYDFGNAIIAAIDGFKNLDEIDAQKYIS